MGDAALAPVVLMLERQLVAKPWGREAGGDWGCGAVFGERIGEIHHRLPAARVGAIPGGDALLVKTLFTDEMLSVQVHPDAATARAMGMARGKDEAWLVLDAEDGAVIGLGLRESMSEAELAAAVADGRVVEAMLWHAVKPGEVLMAPAGTVHAIGAGVTVLEVQENNDLTWRLFDHGRARKLDVVDGLKVARREAWRAPGALAAPGPGRTLLAAGGGFVLERVEGDGVLQPCAGRPVWAAAVSEGVRLGGISVPRGAVALVVDTVSAAAAAGLLLAQAGPAAQPGLWVPEQEAMA
jgi:mannose-6-phosphate isomerase